MRQMKWSNWDCMHETGATSIMDCEHKTSVTSNLNCQCETNLHIEHQTVVTV